ncbi:putative ephrin-receptor like domain-containing protein [Ditylenchus destructor]|uniref:Ephrin-receptor like domain-containing protein n=1 Tax=Ditylenchus destructor TaxID=166010 RepID=A0AAD4R0Z4_9BILA|nr:putative ephrin-receptor like domain-containing protein [Ditylenchus destructor]
MTTLYAGAKSAMECSKECEAGHFLFGKKCMPCPRGFFQQNPNEKFCQRCPSGTTTLEEGAKSFLHCAEKGLCLPNGICKCQPGFAGFDCSIPIDLCNTAYCLNSGICEFNINGSSCRCPTGYTGARCEVPIVDCELIPMHPFCLSSLHSKLRLKYPSENQTASKNEENVGYYCNAINTTNACPNGQCYQNGTCLCNIGFEMQYFDGNRTACVPKDPCDRSPCLNGATCRPLPDESTSAFACDCVPALYTGPFCQYSIRRCSKAKPCENGGICVFENVSKIDYNDPNNSAPIEYYDSSTDSDSSEEDKESRRIYWPVCICPPGFTGLFCESNVSEEQNPCKYGNSLCNHNGECRQYSNSSDFYCECHSGYFGEFCETSLSSCSPEVEGSLQCMNGGTCLSLGPPYNSSTECEICENGLRPNASCSCLFGWTGDRCEIQKNNCLSWECKNGGTCVSLFSSAHCNCAPGFTGEHCETQIEPCKKVPHGDKWVCGEQNINCSANSNAGYNSPYKCYCAPGWNESHACMRSINSCNADDSSANAISATQKPICSGKGTCLPIAGDSQNYFCACNSGRYGSTCEESVNYCVLADVCMNNGICSNVMDENYSVTGYKCDCSSTGHTGLNCEAMEPPEDPCTPNPCQNNGKCTWHRDNNTIECNCTAGYNKADNCTTKSSECDKPNYCNNGTCMTFNDTNYVYCNCPAQQTGVRCEIRKNQNFNLYFTGAPSPVVQKIMSQPFGMQKMVNSGFSLCGWVKYGADSPNSDETQRLKPDTPFMTIMTLGKKMVPIISLSDRHVVFPDVITLNYTLSYRVWHHFCLVFNSSSDESSKIYMEVKFYVDGTIINVFGILPPSNLNETTKAVILLGQSANESNPEPFVGEMSLIQLFNEAVNKESIESMLRDCRLWVRKPEIGVEVGWTDYTIIDMYNAAVMAIYPDKTPPEVIRCPTDQFIVLNNGSRLVEVYWDGSLENMFRDNSGIITQFVSNFRPGQSFGWGEYRVVYIARDTAGNMATCQFKITVSPQVCSFPIHEPTFTLVSITQLDSPFASQFAVAECHSEDYVFNNPKPPFYTCDVMGRWDRFTSLGTSFNLPSCSPTDHPKQDLQGKVEFNGSCSDASNYGAKVRECLLNASKEFGGFCNTEDCTDQINVDEQCEQLSEKALLEKFFPGNMRPMREAGDGEGQTIISVQYTLIVNNTKNPVETVVREQMTSTFGSSFKGVQSQLSCSDTFPLLHVTNVSRRIEQGGSTVLEAMRTKTWMQTVIQCSACAAGEQWEQTDSENGTCVKCPADTFKTDQGPGPCTPCPSDRITGNVTGCIREIDCYKNCTPGSVYDYTTDLCKPCPKGQFMSYYGHLMCFSCPADHTTESTGSITLEACSVTCGAGEEMLSTEECSKCVQGTYRSMEMSRCVQCDLGFSTVDSGSSSPADCNQIYCPVGFYRNPDILDVRINQNEVSFMQVCIACDLGFYQSQLNSTFCEKCPDWKTTANTGSRSSEECDLYVVGCVPNIPNQCPEGMECAQNPETSGYECKVIFGSPTQTQPNTPFWVLVVTGGSALLFAGGIVFLVVIYRKRWMLLYYRHCPSWLMCFKKMTVNDISGNDYSRDWTNVPMTLDSTEVLSSGDISEPISVRETADFSERSMTCNGSSVADRIDEGKGLTPNADRIILGTNNDNNKNNEGSMRGRSVTNILDGFDKRRQNRGSVRSSGSSVRSKSTPTDSDTASETRSIEDPLKEIRSTLLEFLATDNTQNAPIPAKRAETPPPVPQAHLTVQTSMQRNDKHATSFNARQSGNARRFNMYADSSVSQAHQFHSASTGVGSRAMFTTTGSYAHASNAVGRRILTTTLSGEEEELDPLYRYRHQQVESAGNRTGPTSPLSLRNFPKDPVVPPSSYASRNASVSPRSRPSHITQAQNTALISPNFGRGDMGHPDGHINEQKGMYPESFTPTRVTPSTIGVRQKHNPVAPPSYDDDDDVNLIRFGDGY